MVFHRVPLRTAMRPAAIVISTTKCTDEREGTNSMTLLVTRNKKSMFNPNASFSGADVWGGEATRDPVSRSETAGRGWSTPGLAERIREGKRFTSDSTVLAPSLGLKRLTVVS